MFRNLTWLLQGFASIIAAATDPGIPEANRPKALRALGSNLDLLCKLPRIVRRLSFRVAQGLPDDVLWMAGLTTTGSEYRLSRSEILGFWNLGYTQPEQIMLGSPEADQVRIIVFAKVKPSPHAKANWLQDACRDWKVKQRKRAAERHLKRARCCPNAHLIGEFYNSIGTNFEKAFEKYIKSFTGSI